MDPIALKQASWHPETIKLKVLNSFEALGAKGAGRAIWRTRIQVVISDHSRWICNKASPVFIVIAN